VKVLWRLRNQCENAEQAQRSILPGEEKVRGVVEGSG
jgi:hypothetical protein